MKMTLQAGGSHRGEEHRFLDAAKADECCHQGHLFLLGTFFFLVLEVKDAASLFFALTAVSRYWQVTN